MCNLQLNDDIGDGLDGEWEDIFGDLSDESDKFPGDIIDQYEKFEKLRAELQKTVKSVEGHRKQMDISESKDAPPSEAGSTQAPEGGAEAPTHTDLGTNVEQESTSAVAKATRDRSARSRTPAGKESATKPEAGNGDAGMQRVA